MSSVSLLGGGWKGFLERESCEFCCSFLSLSDPHSSPLKATLTVLPYNGEMGRKTQRESSLQLQPGVPLRTFTPRNSTAILVSVAAHCHSDLSCPELALPFHSPCTATWAPKSPQKTGATSCDTSKQGMVSFLWPGWLDSGEILEPPGKEVAP